MNIMVLTASQRGSDVLKKVGSLVEVEAGQRGNGQGNGPDTALYSRNTS